MRLSSRYLFGILRGNRESSPQVDVATYFGAIGSGLTSVFAPTTFLLMMIGVVIGFIIGILPGISAPTTLALMLPFTFHMKPVEAFAFLLGMLSVSIMFGDITSILFGVPGEPLAAAVVLDGHPMAKQGQAGRAMGAALMSSLIGAVVGAIVLALSVPVIRPIVLAFGSPEFFGLAIMGIMFVAVLSRGNMVKGILMGGFGLMLSMVGQDPQSSTQRYTFGMLELWSGLGLVPVTVGLFGVGEIVELWVKQKSISEQAPIGKVGGAWQGCVDCFKHFGLTIRTSLLGTIIGVIPGLGGGSQWMAYAHTVQSSKDQSQFGKGDVRGVIGPGAAMNAKEGGNLITTVAFGVPSSVTMAILLGAFLIQGVVPGPKMLGENLPLTMSFVWVLIVSHVISVGLSFLLLNQMVRITQVRSALILPGVVFLVLFGGFSDNNSLFDMYMTLGAGLVGMIMVWLNWPRPPLVLGLVLGKLAENNLFISYARYDLAFLQRPLLLTIIGVSCVIVFGPMIQERFTHKKDLALTLGEEVSAVEGHAVSKAQRYAEVVFALALLLITAWMVWQAQRWDIRARLFPQAVGYPAVALCVIAVGFAIRSLMRRLAPRVEVEVTVSATEAVLARAVETAFGAGSAVGEEESIPAPVVRQRTMEMVGWMLAIAAGIVLLGFELGSALLTFLFLRVAAHERLRISLLISLGTYLFFYIVFDRALNIPFPPGLVADAFGLEALDHYVVNPIANLLLSLGGRG